MSRCKREGGLRVKGYFRKTLLDSIHPSVLINRKVGYVSCFQDDIVQTDEILTHQPLVTVITVVYNNKKHLEKTIHSVFDQTYPNVEYLVIDGGSTDGTLEILDQYDDKIDYWVSEPDGGIYDAMNKGISLARGKLIALLNSDDEYFADSIEKVVGTWRSNPGNDIFFGDMAIKINDEILFVLKPQASYLEKNMRMNHPTWFVAREVYENVGKFSTQFRIASDYEFARRAKKLGIRFCYVPDVLTIFALGGASYRSFACLFEVYKIRKQYDLSFCRNISYLFVEVCQNGLGRAKDSILRSGRWLQRLNYRTIRG